MGMLPLNTKHTSIPWPEALLSVTLNCLMIAMLNGDRSSSSSSSSIIINSSGLTQG